MKLVSSIEERKSKDARISPETMLANILDDLRAGKMTIGRCAIVIEADDDEGTISVHASGWHGDDCAPAVALLEIGKLTMLVR